MKNRLLFPLMFLFVAQTLAQQTDAPTRDPAAVALLAKSLGVMTGGQAVSDVTLQGTARRIAGSDDETGTAVLKALATGEARVDYSVASGSRSEVRATSTGGSAGQWVGPDGTPHAVPQHNLMTDPTWFFPAFTLGRLVSSTNYVLSYVGREIRNGQAVEHLTACTLIEGADAPADWKATIQHLSQMDIYLDSSTLLPAALTFNLHPDNDSTVDIPIEVRFSDYRSIAGAQMPFHIQKFLNNGLVLDLEFRTASVNTGLELSAFSAQ